MTEVLINQVQYLIPIKFSIIEVNNLDKKPLMKKKSSLGKISKDEGNVNNGRKVSAKRKSSKKTENEGDTKQGY